MIDRLRLAAQRINTNPSRPSLRFMLRETSYPLSPLTRRVRAAPHVQATQRPQRVLLYPGFLATPFTMRYLGNQIARAGHRSQHWPVGMNLGPAEVRLNALERQLLALHQEDDRKIVIIGWSLGGLLAREMAKRRPEAVSKVITLGSPFSGDPRGNNAWRLYQFIAGHKVDEPPVEGEVHEKPPVETVAFWSPRDGIVAPRSAAGRPGERDRATCLRCTHMGFSYSREAIEAILRELERG